MDHSWYCYLCVTSAKVQKILIYYIPAVRSSLVEARMDQQVESVFIVRATALVFGRPQWEALAKRIEAVKGQLKQIQGALTAPIVAV